MKKFYQIIAVVGISLMTTTAFAQSLNGSGASLDKKVIAHLASSPAMHMSSHKPTGTLTYAFLDYPYSDSVYTNSLAQGYAASPSIGQYYIQNFNMHYVSKDTGATLANQLLIRWCAVSFDSLLDAATGTGYTGTGITVDSLFIPMGQENHSGLNDTLVISIVKDSAWGFPGLSTVYWSTTIIQDTGLSGKGKSWFYGHTIVLAPNISVPGKFSVVMQYYDASKVDTAGFLFGYPTFACSNPAQGLPDTSQIGAVIPLTSPSSGKIRANSFANGFEYFYSGHTGPPLTLPNRPYGDFIGYNCTTPSEFSASSFQDIAMYAEVSFTDVSGINEVATGGLSVAQNAPNPFNKNSQINYNMVKSSDVLFTIYDMTGRKLVETNYSNVAPGQHVINLSANQFTPGVYFYSFKVNGTEVTKRMVITQ